MRALLLAALTGCCEPSIVCEPDPIPGAPDICYDTNDCPCEERDRGCEPNPIPGQPDICEDTDPPDVCPDPRPE